LVNFYYDPKTPCEAQFCLIDPQDDAKCHIRGDYNHKLYELSREKLGPLV